MFSKPYTYAPAGIFSLSHFVLFFITLGLIALGLFLSRNLSKDQSMKVLKIIAIITVCLEVIKDIYQIITFGFSGIEHYLPLYFCSIFLFAICMASFGKGEIKDLGLNFLSTAGILAGLCYLVFPNTSLRTYPVFHFIAMHSFTFHGFMIYSGILILIKGLYTPKLKDMWKYFVFVTAICLITLGVNLISGKNFMFVSEPVEFWPCPQIYEISPVLYSISFIIGQNLGCYFIAFGLYKLISLIVAKSKQSKQEKIIKSTLNLDEDEEAKQN